MANFIDVLITINNTSPALRSGQLNNKYKTKPHTIMIDVVELVRISRGIHTGRIPRLGDVAAVISPKGANATSAVIQAFRNRYRNSRMSVQEVVRLSNWAGLPVATFTAADIDVNLNIKLTNHHNDDNENKDTSRGSAC